MTAGRYDNKQMQELLTATEPQGMTRGHLNLWRPSEDEENRLKYIPEFLFRKTHKEAVIALMNKNGLSALTAIQEINRLAEDDVAALVNLYDLGINGQFIRDHRHEYEFSRYGFSLHLHQLMATYQLALDVALPELNNLSRDVMEIVTLFYGDGLRGETLRSLRAGISHVDFESSYTPKPEQACHLKFLYDLLSPRHGKERSGYLATIIQADLKQGKTWEETLLNAAH